MARVFRIATTIQGSTSYKNPKKQPFTSFKPPTPTAETGQRPYGLLGQNGENTSTAVYGKRAVAEQLNRHFYKNTSRRSDCALRTDSTKKTELYRNLKLLRFYILIKTTK